jgi:hypothetical protein
VEQIRVVALILLVLGVLALAYGGFTYTKKTSTAQIGPLELTVKDRETVNIPVWAGLAAVTAGGGLLLLGARRS